MSGLEEGYEESKENEYESDAVEGNDGRVMGEGSAKNLIQVYMEEVEDDVVVPTEGMLYCSLDVVFSMVQNYAKSKGFAFVKYSTSKDNHGEVKYQKFACHRAGTRKVKEDSLGTRRKPMSRVGCPVRVTASRGSDGYWRVGAVRLEHNHEVSPSKAIYLKHHRKVIPSIRRHIEFNDDAGIRTSNNVQVDVSQQGGPNKMQRLSKDCWTYVERPRRLRIKASDADVLHQLLLRMQRLSRKFIYEITVDEEGRLSNVFWVDHRSCEAYKEFSDVITLDTTCLVNNFKMPFVTFIGVNHHGHPILLGCGLIANEEEETFRWLFENWLRAMGGVAPRAIITDECTSIRKAIEHVFPLATHRLCLWHILCKFPDKAVGFTRYKDLLESFLETVFDSLTVDIFESKWNAMLTEYELHERTQLMEWFQALYDEREKWVPAFVKNKFWAGMSLTQRTDSMNSYFYGYVLRETSVKTFVEQYENVVGAKIEKEIVEDAKCMQSYICCKTKFPFETQFQKAYTHNIFKKVQDELDNVVYCEVDLVNGDSPEVHYNVSEMEYLGIGETRLQEYLVTYNIETEEVNCICRMFDWKGLLCRHALKVLLKRRVTIVPEKYIIRRWRRDVKRPHSKIKLLGVGGRWVQEFERQCKMETKFYELVDRAIDSDEKCVYVENAMKDMSLRLDNGTWGWSEEVDERYS